MGFMYTQAGIFAFIVTYYLLHKWFWSQLLWLSFGSLRCVFFMTFVHSQLTIFQWLDYQFRQK